MSRTRHICRGSVSAHKQYVRECVCSRADNKRGSELRHRQSRRIDGTDGGGLHRKCRSSVTFNATDVIQTHVAVCAKKNACYDQPCQHRSLCRTGDCSSSTDYECLCTNGYDGDECQTIKREPLQSANMSNVFAAFTYSSQLMPDSEHCYSLSIDKTLYTAQEALAFCNEGGADRLGIVHSSSELSLIMGECLRVQ